MSASVVPTRIRVLILEDVEVDAELMVAEQRRAGFDPEWRRAQTEAEYLDSLGPGVDVILADYNMPGFDAWRALELLQRRELDIPFIVVSGTISEEVGVECMKRGATDYLLKDRLARLGPAVAQALDSRRIREEKRKMEAALRESEERYRLITETIRDAIFMVDLEGRFVLGNRSGAELTGYSLAELAGLRVFSLLTPEGAQEVAARLSAAQAGQEVSPWLETEFLRKDGTRVWVEAQMASVLKDGQVVGRLGVVRDISERKRAEETLRLLESAVRQAGDSVVITTSQLERPGPTILFVNPAFTRMTGYTAEEAVGRSPRILQGPATDRAIRWHASQELAAGRDAYAETVNYRKDGTSFHVAWHVSPVRDEQGRITHFVGIQRDITEARRAAEHLQEQRDALFQSEKLAAMGQLLAGVAHELNNPLSVLIGHSVMLRQAVPPALAGRATKIVAAAERCARIVRNFLALARHHPMEYQRVNLNQVLEGAVELLAYQLRVDNVEVTFTLAPDLPILWGDSDQLHQVLVNLVSNAHQAMRESAPPRRLMLTSAHGAGRVAFEVADTGPGIPAELRSKIFDPFFTTKAPGQGTGLGLSLCRGIVERHGGTIRVESVPGRGATFRVELPLGEPPTRAAAAPGAAAARAAPCAVLVVDDEPDVAELLVEMLSQDGHRVDTAANGLAALEKLGGRSYDVVFCDVRMPDLDGPALYRRVEESRPELVRRWIFLTGDVLGPETADFLERTNAMTLTKPFTVDDLRRALAAVAAPG